MFDFSRFNFTIFITEAIFYIAAFAAAIASALEINQIILVKQEIARLMASAPPGANINLPPDLAALQNLNSPEIVTVGQFLIAFFIATVFFLIFLKTKYGGGLFKILFVLAIFAGAQVIFRVWLNPELSVILALILTSARFMIPLVIVHDIVIIAAITGIAVNLGINIKPSEAILLLIVIAVYDFIAVYVTGHMVKMFKSTVALGTIFAMMVPQNIGNFLKPVSEARQDSKKEFVYLGGGDLAFPLILAVSAAVKVGVISAVYAAGGAIVGLFALNLMFMMQKERRPMAGMPPLAAFSILGFLISLIKF